MGKMISVYLTDEEAKQLQKFCQDNQCTQYSTVKTAIRELTTRSVPEVTNKAEVSQAKTQHGEQWNKAEGNQPQKPLSILARLTRSSSSARY